MAGFGRWQRLLLDAVAEDEVVGLMAALDRHLGRHGTRSEGTAARRAASRLAADGQLGVHRVRVGPGEADAGGGFVVISRPGATFDHDQLQRAARGHTVTVEQPASVADEPTGTAQEQLTAAHRAVQAVAGVEHAAVDARHVHVDHLPAEVAARLAEQLEPGLVELTALQQSLRRHSRHAEAEADVRAGE